jgi:hypothetical protein
VLLIFGSGVSERASEQASGGVEMKWRSPGDFFCDLKTMSSSMLVL